MMLPLGIISKILLKEKALTLQHWGRLIHDLNDNQRDIVLEIQSLSETV